MMSDSPFLAAIAPLPPIFDSARAARTIEDLQRLAPESLTDARWRALLEAASGNSPFLARVMLHEASFLAELRAQGPDAALAWLNADALDLASESDLAWAQRRLRVARRRTALSIALADISGLYDLSDVTAALSRFADASVGGALRFLLAQAAKDTGHSALSPQELELSTGLIVLAMGKHGAFELNYSSDIDLIVLYEESRFPFLRAGEKRLAAIDIVQKMLRLIAEVTPDGYVFRVDLRLRPDAGSTQVAISTEAAELYYESMGQNWERAAMIKARACAGDREAAAQFLGNLSPYIWRKNLDFAAIEDIHSIKRQIHAHGGHGQIAVAGQNIKLGRGGIREIEFFVQTQQLILGGRDSSLRSPATLTALGALRARGAISPEAERDLTEAYRFLRTLEHRLQMIDDQQTHKLPKDPDALDHVARFMGFLSTADFDDMLLWQLTKVQAHYAQLFEGEAPLAAGGGSLVFTGVDNDPETIANLKRMGFTRAEDVAATIRGWHHGRIRATRSPRARELLTKLMPALLEALGKTVDPDSAFTIFDRFISGLPSGVAVLSLFLAQPPLLRLVSGIAGSAPRLADYLGRNPAVLDAMMDTDFFERLLDTPALKASLDDMLSRFPGYEWALDAARRFAREQMFRVGVHVIRGSADAEQAGPANTAIAETVIAGLYAPVEAEIAAAHGRIQGGGFAVVAQGKLGGREMAANSDLDLVFVYTHDPDAAASDGPKPLPPSAYFARLAQRYIAALTAQTAEGRLYEVDMRLRPSGNQGPVAVRLDTFVHYHREEAWTWERMALTRARVVAGPASLHLPVEAAIRGALTRAVDPAILRADARAMREKLASQFRAANPWDVKFAPGGLVDIEFIAQVLQLVRAPENPEVLDTNTVGALRRLAGGSVLSLSDADTLVAAAHEQQAINQVLRIALEGTFDPTAATPGLKALLTRIAGKTRFELVEARLVETQARVRALFDSLLA